MKEKRQTNQGTRFLVAVACFVVVVAGMRAASSILVPFLLSAFIAIICSPLLFWMQKKGIPNALSVLLILTGIVAAGLLTAAFVGTSVNSFLNELPVYQEHLSAKMAASIAWLSGHGIEVSDNVLMDYFNPAKIFRMASSTLSGLKGLLTNVFMILLTVVFILLEASGFPRKLYAALRDPEESLSQFNTFTESVNRYLALKTLFSAITGILICIWLSVLGVEHSLLWGLVAFLLNYVPNIGSIIAAVPAVLMALIQLGISSAMLTCLGYLAVNVIIGSIMEPKFMGRGLGLSTLVIFLSLVFWGWVLGPIGMFLSVPLTMIVKIALESSEDTRWIAIMLGSAPQDGAVKRVEAKSE
jgi:AI-2 transport protein TqsA